jgi:hypothetical protein
MKLRYQFALCLAAFGMFALVLYNWFIAATLSVVLIIAALVIVNHRLERKNARK